MNKEVIKEMMKYPTSTEIHIGNLKYAMEMNSITTYQKLHKKMCERMEVVNKEIKKSNPERAICDCLGYKQFKNYIDHKASNPPISFYYALSKTLDVSINFLLGREFTIKPFDEINNFFSNLSINKMLRDPSIGQTLNLIFESENFEKITIELFKFFTYFSYPIHTESKELNDYINLTATDIHIQNNINSIYDCDSIEFKEVLKSIGYYINHIRREDMEISISLKASEYLCMLQTYYKPSSFKDIEKKSLNLSRSEKVDDALSSFRNKPLKKEINELCGFTKNSISSIINKKESFTVKTEIVLNLCDCLNLSIDYLLGTIDSNEPYNYNSLGISKLSFHNLNNFKYTHHFNYDEKYLFSTDSNKTYPTSSIINEAYRPIIESEELPLFIDLLKQITTFNKIRKEINSIQYISPEFDHITNLNKSDFMEDMDYYECLEELDMDSFLEDIFFKNTILNNKYSNLLKKIKDNDNLIKNKLLQNYRKKFEAFIHKNYDLQSKAKVEYTLYLETILNSSDTTNTFAIEDYNDFYNLQHYFQNTNLHKNPLVKQKYKYVTRKQLKDLIEQSTLKLSKEIEFNRCLDFEDDLIFKIYENEFKGK